MPANVPKRRRAVGVHSCDNCHRRKVRCDGEPGSACSECSSLNLQCTRTVAHKKRGPKPGSERKSKANDLSAPPSSQESIRSLIAAILASPTTCIIPTSTDDVRKMLVDFALYAVGLEKKLDFFRRESPLNQASGSTEAIPALEEAEAETPPPRSEIDLDEALGDRFKGLSLKHYQGLHFGKSSHFMLLQTALDVRDDLNGQPATLSVHLKRSEYWDLKPWHTLQENEPAIYQYPPDDLLDNLVDLYFEYFHPFYPILHRPTFQNSLAAKFHLSDRAFGSTVLAVCAIASRRSDDPRVLYNDTSSLLSAGWKYFDQISFFQKSFLERPSVYTLQVYPLAATFVHATQLAEVAWVIIGHGIHLGELIGVHRSGFGKGRDPKEIELWRRAFFHLIVLDTATSIVTGRPRVSNMNDLDLELPTPCDDEYWETPDPQAAFKQPENKPSKMMFWIHHIKLMEIMGFTLRSIYSARRLETCGPTSLTTTEWNQKSVMELDSQLNKWIDAIPDFLKYDRHHEDSIFTHQSVMLMAGYYWAQILAHRPFIPRPGQNSFLTFPSLAICTNAARSCIKLLYGHHQRYNLKIRWPHIMPAVFGCAIVILINLWRGIRAKVPLNPVKEMEDVQKCLEMLTLYEERFEMSGRLRDILLSIISVSQLPSMDPEQTPSLKRTRTSDQTPSSEVSAESEIAGSQQASHSGYNNTSTASQSPLASDSFNFTAYPDAEWSLPVTSDDLGITAGVELNSQSNLSWISALGPRTGDSEYQFNSSQFTSRASNQDEWNNFMTEVDGLLNLINYPPAEQS